MPIHGESNEHNKSLISRLTPPWAKSRAALVALATVAVLAVAGMQTIRAAGQAVPRVNAEKLGKQFGVSVSTIKAILARKTWKHL